MFRRRDRRAPHQVARELIWPSAGWRRTLLYMRHRIQRLPGTPYAIAMGLACGVGISFTPFIGFHFVLGATMAWSFRSSIIASAIGTVAGNPWTFPFIWAAAYGTGSFLLGRGGVGSEEIVLSADMIFGILGDLFSLEFEAFVTFWNEIFAPMLLGGTIYGALAGGVTYVVFFYLVKDYQKMRRQRILARARSVERDLSADSTSEDRKAVGK